VRDEAAGRLRERLLRIAHGEVNRRRGQLEFGGPELEDIAEQAASDATVAVLGKLGEFRGEARFTTWATKFAIVEVSSKVGRHVWRKGGVHLDPDAWERMPDRLGLGLGQEAESRELLVALRRAVDTQLSDRQRRVFEAIVLNEVPLDGPRGRAGQRPQRDLQVPFRCRGKLRADLVANGYLDS
jgi:RNA polymerase sigma-70 factor, ECF subfamily